MSAVLTLHNGNDGRPYDDFLREKVAFDRAFGFDVRDEWLNTPTLFDILDMGVSAA